MREVNEKHQAVIIGWSWQCWDCWQSQASLSSATSIGL